MPAPAAIMASAVQKAVAPHAAHKEEQYMMQHGSGVRTGTFTVNKLRPGGDGGGRRGLGGARSR